MKWLIASDIHGSAKFCRLLMQRINAEQPDKILLLGDLLYHGPRNDLPEGYAPKEVIEMLNLIKGNLLCVRGNCEAEVDQMVLDFPVMADYVILDFDGKSVYATHGHHQNPENPFPGAKNYILLNGHTHVPVNKKYDDFVYMNPGSVSIPKENSPHSYMTYEKGIFLWKKVEDGCVYEPKQ